MVPFQFTEMTLAFGPRQFVELRGQDDVFDVLAFQPRPGAAIAVEAGVPAVDEQESPSHRRAAFAVYTSKKRLGKGCELGRCLLPAPGVSESG